MLGTTSCFLGATANRSALAEAARASVPPYGEGRASGGGRCLKGRVSNGFHAGFCVFATSTSCGVRYFAFSRHRLPRSDSPSRKNAKSCMLCASRTSRVPGRGTRRCSCAGAMGCPASRCSESEVLNRECLPLQIRWPRSKLKGAARKPPLYGYVLLRSKRYLRLSSSTRAFMAARSWSSRRACRAWRWRWRAPRRTARTARWRWG